MIFNNLVTQLGQRAEVAKYEVKAHSPELLIGLGIAGMVASTVLACRATLKADVVLKQRKEDIKKCEECVNDPKFPDYTKDDFEADKKLINVKSGIKVIGLFVPAVVSGAVGVSFIVKSDHIHRERQASAIAAYAGLEQIFNKYREGVVAEYGEEVDKKLRHGLRTEKIKNEEGEVEEVKVIDDLPDDDYSVFFDESSPYYEKNRHYNQTLLLNEQARWNNVLRDRAHINIHGIGFVTLIEIYRDLGISLPPSKMKKWKDLGWCIDINDPYYDPKKQFISFGVCDEIYRPKRPGTANCVDSMPGYDPVFVISPNVQGNIYSLMS